MRWSPLRLLRRFTQQQAKPCEFCRPLSDSDIAKMDERIAVNIREALKEYVEPVIGQQNGSLTQSNLGNGQPKPEHDLVH